MAPCPPRRFARLALRRGGSERTRVEKESGLLPAAPAPAMAGTGRDGPDSGHGAMGHADPRFSHADLGLGHADLGWVTRTWADLDSCDGGSE